MSFLNPQTKELNCKIVYYGPAFGGKTTNLRQIFERVRGKAKGPGQKDGLITLAEGLDRTLYFDFLPLTLGEVGGTTVRFHVYTVPGQPTYEKSRSIILKGVDGVVFVADSQVERLEEDLASLKDLERQLDEGGSADGALPLIFQYNKRDLPRIAPVEEMRRALNPNGAPDFAAVATRGEGVMEAFQEACKMVLKSLRA